MNHLSQAVIVIESDDGRLYPLLENYPKSLLPLANRKLLSFQLDTLFCSGVTEVFIICSTMYETVLVQFLAEYQRDSFFVDLVVIDDLLGDADALRAVSDRIHQNFIVFGSDVVFNGFLGPLVNFHTSRNADITILMSSLHPGQEDTDKRSGSSRFKIDEEDEETVVLSDDYRLLMKEPVLEIDTVANIQKITLGLHCHSNLRMDLVDAGLYVISNWILKLLNDNKSIISVKNDLLPYIIESQYQNDADLMSLKKSKQMDLRIEKNINIFSTNEISPEEVKSRSCMSLSNSFIKCFAFLLEKENDVSFQNNLSGYHEVQSSTDMSSILHENRGNFRTPLPTFDAANHFVKNVNCQQKGSKNYKNDPTDCDNSIRSKNSPYARGNLLCTRMLNIPSYMMLNKDLPLLYDHNDSSWSRLQGYGKREQSTIGIECTIGDKVTYKACTIGSKCRIHSKSKLNNSVIMDNVIIGENVTIQNSILSNGVTIGNNCNLNDCNIGPNVHIESDTKMKSESICADNN